MPGLMLTSPHFLYKFGASSWLWHEFEFSRITTKIALRSAHLYSLGKGYRRLPAYLLVMAHASRSECLIMINQSKF